MSGEVLSQSQIDALIAKNAPEEGPGLSPEVEALLTQGRKNREESKRVLPPRPAERPTPTSPASDGSPSKRPTEASGKGSAPAVAREAGSGRADAAQGDGGRKAAGNAAPGTTVSVTSLEAVIKPLCATMETLEKRLEKAEAIVGRVGVMERDMAGNSGVSSQSSDQVMTRILQLERQMSNITRAVQTLSLNLQGALNLVKDTNDRFRDIRRGLQGTLSYDIRETFECQHCGSRGYVVGLIKCGECEEENWWGWWPPP
ncbi:hypothetical protein M1O17_01770 [Dehalococcoidia bacterium]|nr:hypothetical protein [Dehalococcoidia bacterium]